ncbi:DUF2202 domain-containing protein [Algoriphagus sp. oki45]|uniref:DUF2202 domain-containing protein n=1 Tax=Algoriphagus sp. oki45 TaxID=3067294 RepID=UPI0027F84412|nr:DUF2202 domain-containing protein [Algoriphagus sp. oki45]
MKRIFLPVALMVISLTGCQEAEKPSSTPLLSEQELNDLLFTREEEKLAHDVYTYAFEKYGTSVFQNISRSETQHIASVLQLMDANKLTDPLNGSTSPGEFSDPVLKSLYAELTSKVDQSLADAIRAGLLIEDMDIQDLRLAVASTQKPELIQLYEKLLCGSENHMRAFYRQAQLLGVEYTPAHLTQSEFDLIIQSETSSCQPN